LVVGSARCLTDELNHLPTSGQSVLSWYRGSNGAWVNQQIGTALPGGLKRRLAPETVAERQRQIILALNNVMSMGARSITLAELKFHAGKISHAIRWQPPHLGRLLQHP
jgi:hypothetical protein